MNTKMLLDYRGKLTIEGNINLKMQNETILSYKFTNGNPRIKTKKHIKGQKINKKFTHNCGIHPESSRDRI